jgi:hypothetical protein
VPGAAPLGDAEAGVEPGPARHRGLPRPVAGGAGQRRLRQRLQGAVGAVPAARGARRALDVGPAGGRAGRRLDVPELSL